MTSRLPPRIQGDIGERAAAAWLLQQGYPVAYPFGHSPDCDLWTEIDRALYRVQVKTSTVLRKDRWEVSLRTSGGNQSWNRIVKLMDASRCDYLFVLVGDGRQWFMPSRDIGGGHSILLGGPKYASFEVDSNRSIEEFARPGRPRSTLTALSAGCPSG